MFQMGNVLFLLLRCELIRHSSRSLGSVLRGGCQGDFFALGVWSPRFSVLSHAPGASLLTSPNLALVVCIMLEPGPTRSRCLVLAHSLSGVHSGADDF